MTAWVALAMADLVAVASGALFHGPGELTAALYDPYPGAPRRPGSKSRARRPATNLVGPRRRGGGGAAPGDGARQRFVLRLPRPGCLARRRHGAPAGLANFLRRHRTGARAAGPCAGARVDGGRGRACLRAVVPPGQTPAAFGLRCPRALPVLLGAREGKLERDRLGAMAGSACLYLAAAARGHQAAGPGLVLGPRPGRTATRVWRPRAVVHGRCSCRVCVLA